MRIKLPGTEQFLYLANHLLDRLLFGKVNKVDQIQSILIVKWDEIGDMALSTHVFELLRKRFPKAEMHLICKPFVKGLLEADPNLNFIHTSLDAFNRRFDLVLELRGTWGSLFKSLVHMPANRASRASVRFKNRGKQLHEISTNLEVIRPFLGQMDETPGPHLYFSKDDQQKVEFFLKENGIDKFAIIHAGARRQLRQWPLERFALAVEYLHRKYKLDIVFAGTEEDESAIDSITSDLGFKTYKFTRGFSLSQFSCLCSKASVYLGNESGPLHIASAFGVPMVALFGPGVKDVFYPLNKRAIVLHHVLECNPCDQIHCVYPENPCIARIQVNDVLEALDKVYPAETALT